jgi:hypothetical protein
MAEIGDVSVVFWCIGFPELCCSWVATSPRFGLSVGEVERPKSAETREESGPKGGSGVGMEAGAREAVHRDRGGQTRPVPTRAALRRW